MEDLLSKWLKKCKSVEEVKDQLVMEQLFKTVQMLQSLRRARMSADLQTTTLQHIHRPEMIERGYQAVGGQTMEVRGPVITASDLGSFS